MTTISPHGGWCRYKTAPQGYIASGDGYSRRFDEIVSHVPNKTKCIDDTLLRADNLSENFTQAVNPDKFVFGADTVEFAGFVTFGIPDECATDGDPEFTAAATQQLLKEWGVHHRLSSVTYPHSNCRAEIGLKTVKRLITNNTDPHGSLDTNTLQQAILQYRNTPDPNTKHSPAQCVFGRPIKDFIPILPGRYKPHPTWSDTLAAREEALRNRHMKAAERWSKHTKRLPPLAVSNHVRIQNQTGPHPMKWDKTGIVIEVRQFDRYVVRVDGSGRITIRNRKFLRKYLPVCLQPPPPHHQR